VVKGVRRARVDNRSTTVTGARGQKISRVYAIV
jgi:hypothetical protein